MTVSDRMCATEGCDRPAVGRFEAGGFGSEHCQPCLSAIQSRRSSSRGEVKDEEAAKEACDAALQFVMPKLQAIKKEKGLVGVWCQAWLQAWNAASSLSHEQSPSLPRSGTLQDGVTLDGNEIWEWLFGRLKGDVPAEIDDDLLGELADHINTHFLSCLSSPSSVEPVANVEAYGIYLTDGRFMDIASSVKDDAISMAEQHYEPDQYTVRPLYASPKPNTVPGVTEEMVERAARAIAGTAYEGIYFTSRSREQYIEAEWINHSTDARTALTAALQNPEGK